MSVIFILIGISACVGLTFLAIFLWSVRNGQYDDSITPAIRILFEDNLNKTNKTEHGEDSL